MSKYHIVGNHMSRLILFCSAIFIYFVWSMICVSGFPGHIVDFCYTPRKLCLWWVYCFHVVRACVRPCVRASVHPSVRP